MQWNINLFAAIIGLAINTDKTVAMRQPPPNAEYNALRIHVNGPQRKTVKNFAYLDSTSNQPGVLEGHHPGPTGLKTAVKTGATIYGANQTTTTEAKRGALKSQAPPSHNANDQLLPSRPRCQRTLRARVGLFGHRRTQCNDNLATENASTATSEPALTTTTSGDHTSNALRHCRRRPSPRPSSLPEPRGDGDEDHHPSHFHPRRGRPLSSNQRPPHHRKHVLALNLPSSRSRIGLVVRLRIHCTVTGESVPGSTLWTSSFTMVEASRA
ncbi:hypothetical protein SprV_0902741900 [Sparganum proliferum]